MELQTIGHLRVEQFDTLQRQCSQYGKDLLGGIRSTCTYVGAPTLKQLSKCTTFSDAHSNLIQFLFDKVYLACYNKNYMGRHGFDGVESRGQVQVGVNQP